MTPAWIAFFFFGEKLQQWASLIGVHAQAMTGKMLGKIRLGIGHMRTALLLACLLLITAQAGAVTYKWEDAKGVHYTDDFSSVPDELRKRSVPVDEDGVINFGKTVPLRNNTGAKRKNLEEIERINVARDRIVMEAIRQHQVDVISQMNRQSSDLQKRLVTLFANQMVIWFVPLLLFAFIWILSLFDIMRSDFSVPAYKYAWLVFVLLLPPVGMILYYWFGRGQKAGVEDAPDHGEIR